jgi:hypothetical protein
VSIADIFRSKQPQKKASATKSPKAIKPPAKGKMLMTRAEKEAREAENKDFNALYGYVETAKDYCGMALGAIENAKSESALSLIDKAISELTKARKSLF